MITAELSIRKIGNSSGVIIPAAVLNEMRATEIGSKLIISVDDNGEARLEKKRETMAFPGPFKGFERFAAAWDGEESGVEMADRLRSRNNKELAEW